MTQNYHRKQTNRNERRKSLSIYPSTSTSIGEDENEDEENDKSIELNLKPRLSICVNAQRRLSTVSQLFVPHGEEYHPQEHIPPSGIENQTNLFVSPQLINEHRRLSIISRIYQQIDDETIRDDREEEKEKKFVLRKSEKKILFLIEPLLSGLIVFPLLVLFWECGWNLFLIFLNVLNGFSSNLHLDEFNQEDFESYSFLSLILPYLVAQILLLLFYLFQQIFFDFLEKQNSILRWILLKCHILLLATSYIVQWEMLWTLFDQFTPHEWYFEVTLSFASLLALIVFVGHLSDLICSPFIYSYDSIDYCLFIGCPLLTRQMKQWKIFLINYILYEWIISTLSIVTWRGFYHSLDEFLYPEQLDLSAGICLIIGYSLYFPLMFFQTYLEELNSKYEFWTFISVNFPQFYRNIRHLFAFASCVFAWRGFWVLYDNYLYIFEDYYKTYLFIYLLSFFVLSLCQTASSINGPLTHIEDEHLFFPLYPHSYVSIVYKQIRQKYAFQSKSSNKFEENTKL